MSLFDAVSKQKRQVFREISGKHLSNFSLVVLLILLVGCSKGNDDMDAPIPDPEPEIPVVTQISHAKIGTYSVDIYTPESYDESKEYPVIYFNDGQSLFKGGGFGMELLLNSMIEENLIEEVIMVGIYAGANRAQNYRPYHDPEFTKGPEGLEYTEDIINLIIPHIDEHFSTIQNASGRGIMGYSLGGLHATWAAIRYPNYFSKVVALSPSYWVGNFAIFSEQPSANPKLRIWFDVGTEEFNPYVPFQRLLTSQGFRYGRDAFYYEVVGGTHDIFSWRNRIEYPLLAFYGRDKNFDPTTMEVMTEVFPDRHGGAPHLRLNPVVTTINGVKFSLAREANYTVEDPEIGSVLEDGRFFFKKPQDLIVKVQYQNLTEFHTIYFSQVQILGGG